MNRDHRWQTGYETPRRLRHQCLHITPFDGRLHFNRTKRPKHSAFIDAWTYQLAGTFLRDAPASFEPGRSRIRICTIARRTGTEWTRGKQLPKNSRRALDRSPLVVHWQKSAYG